MYIHSCKAIKLTAKAKMKALQRYMSAFSQVKCEACRGGTISGVARRNNTVGHNSGHDAALTDKLVMKFALCIFVEVWIKLISSFLPYCVYGHS